MQSPLPQLIDVPATTQLTGGNIGNIFAPMVIAIGVTAVAIRVQEAHVLRLVALPALLLLVMTTLLTAALASVDW